MAGPGVNGGTVAKRMRVTLEIGPKGKRVVAVAPDWAGLERGAKTGEEAVEKLRAYMPRYARVAKLAKLDAEFAALKDVSVVEEYTGTGSTDFWGISFAFSSIDKRRMSAVEFERELTLMQACWTFFDDVRRRVSAEMQRGPRSGGRDRDRIVLHTFAAEWDFAKRVGVVTPDGPIRTAKGLKAYRDTYVRAIRDYYSQGKMAASVPDSAHRLSHLRPRVGNARQGPDCVTSVRPSSM